MSRVRPARTLVVEAPVQRDGRASATLRLGSERWEVAYEFSDEAVSDRMDPWLPVTLLPAMRLGAALRLESEVSPRLLGSIDAVEALYRSWYPTFDAVPVSAWGPRVPAPRTGEVGALFSGGVDSFYTALTNRDELGVLIFGRGLSADVEPAPAVSGRLRRVADELGLAFIEVRSDVRRFSDPIVRWVTYHGAALAAAGLLLAPRLRTVLVPGNLVGPDAHAFGSHPDLDPLWSSDEVEIVHDGFGPSRIQKTVRVAESDVALRHLRVCPRSAETNCGRCEKCLRTMVDLRAAGALDRCTTFPSGGLDLGRLTEARVYAPNKVRDWKNSLEFVEESADDPELAAALRRLIARSTRPTVRRGWWQVRSARRARKAGRAL